MSSQSSQDRIRKVASYFELVKTPLTRKELDDAKERIVDYMDEIETIEREAKEASEGFKQRIKQATSKQEEARNLYRTKNRQSNDLVEEWLKGNNEIERVNTRTGEILGVRTARPEELQQTLPFSPANPPDDRPGGAVEPEQDFAPEFDEAEEGDEEDEVH